jgi:glyoxylase-like metal-dependent hydrolase (beta-lactamase superfamily II)
MPSLQKISDQLWTGEISTRGAEHHPFAMYDTTEEVAADVAFHKDFVNVTGFRTGDGLVLVDTGSFHPAQNHKSFRGIRSWNSERLHTAIYTHGHVDHAYGLPPFLREAEDRGWARPAVVGHEAVEPRMRRYVETAGYNEVINERQFGVSLEWPTDPLVPTVSYRESLDLRVGDRELRLFHARGETDDHTWVFLPQPRVLCTGDLFIWSAPNAGNPQKVQRYAIDWSRALRRMAAHRSRGHRRLPRVPVCADAGAVEPGRARLRHRRDGETAGRAGGEAVPAARVRRAGVHRPQRRAAPGRLVQRRPE